MTLNYTEAKAYLNEKENIWLIPEQLGIPGFEIPTINYKYFNGKKYRYCYGSGVFERGHFANSVNYGINIFYRIVKDLNSIKIYTNS